MLKALQCCLRRLPWRDTSQIQVRLFSQITFRSYLQKAGCTFLLRCWEPIYFFAIAALQTKDSLDSCFCMFLISAFSRFCWHLTDWPSGPTFSNVAELQDISIHKIILGIANVTGGLKLQLKTLYHSFKYTMIDTTIFWPKFHNNILLNSEFESPLQDLVNPSCNKRLH